MRDLIKDHPLVKAGIAKDRKKKKKKAQNLAGVKPMTSRLQGVGSTAAQSVSTY